MGAVPVLPGLAGCCKAAPPGSAGSRGELGCSLPPGDTHLGGGAGPLCGRGGAQVLVHAVQQPEQELKGVVLRVAAELRAVLGHDALQGTALSPGTRVPELTDTPAPGSDPVPAPARGN